MKHEDKYPEAEDGGASLPPPPLFLGLHPLVWVFLVVLGITAFAGFDHLEHASWDNWHFSDDADDDEESDEEDEDDEGEGAPKPSATSTGQ